MKKVYIVSVDEGYPCPEPIDDFHVRAVFWNRNDADEYMEEEKKGYGVRVRLDIEYVMGEEPKEEWIDSEPFEYQFVGE